MECPGSRATVLVVEDDPDSGALVAECLQGEGYGTVLVRNGRQALDALPSTRPHAILLDLMTEMDGFAFLRQHAKLPGPRSPVLATSAFDSYLSPSRRSTSRA